jgi:hypothetical protein
MNKNAHRRVRRGTLRQAGGREQEKQCGDAWTVHGDLE